MCIYGNEGSLYCLTSHYHGCLPFVCKLCVCVRACMCVCVCACACVCVHAHVHRDTKIMAVVHIMASLSGTRPLGVTL